MKTRKMPTGEASLSGRFRNPIQNWLETTVRLVRVYRHTVQDKHLEYKESAENGRFVGWLIDEGSVDIHTLGETYSARKGDWVFLSQAARRHVFTPQSEILSVHCNLDWPTGRSMLGHESPVIFQAHKHPELQNAAMDLLQCAENITPPQTEYISVADVNLETFLSIQRRFYHWLELVMSLMSGPYQAEVLEPPNEPVAEQLTRLLAAHNLQQPVNLTEVAGTVGLGRRQAERLFRAMHGQTMHGFLDQRRLRLATGLLREGGEPIKSISFRLGFADSNHFTKWFKKKAGSSPIRYREGTMS